MIKELRNIQITLTVEESKSIIALGILKHPLVVAALDKGKILFKGGTTVSKITEKLLGVPLRVSGRITKRGTVSSKDIVQGPHSILYCKGKWVNIDDKIAEESLKLSKNDLVICGANAIDNFGNAAMMAGSPGGGGVGQSIGAWSSEAGNILIPVGIEKMILGDLRNIIKKSNRHGKSISWGMSVGLLPLVGDIFTEIDAIKLLADVDCYPIGSGGLFEANGSITLEIIPYTKDDYEKIIQILKELKSEPSKISGIDESLIECKAPCQNCSRHMGCGYKRKEIN
jgi:hypothetical protein